ncbi:Antigenic thaumatin-like protein [Penicillium macrosclerotiorum]|uniref:Antigenic thaumatin-like protein n=1 Tax=Penicillium macrosclerotiorum TaxID=303699 RepID=UPI0025475A42|nr:Antigenic thaumatin-like protein [Penicillium macrosclerotiorum]KAJ5669527.1 Antigenic thaumatin-like protein [Penicillium macrosclerotiorum]
MIFSNILSIFTLASLALSSPTVEKGSDVIPSGAFPPSSSSVSSSLKTPTPVSSVNSRLGRAIIVNHCRTPIFVWSVGSLVRPVELVWPGGRFYEKFRHDTITGGIALKISTSRDGLYKSAPQTIFAYNLNEQEVWYDLSDVFGDPFTGHPVVLSPSEPQIAWASGVPPSGSQVRVQAASTDLVLTLC